MAAGCTQDRDEAPSLEVEVGDGAGLVKRLPNVMMPLDVWRVIWIIYFDKSRQASRECDTKEE